LDHFEDIYQLGLSLIRSLAPGKASRHWRETTIQLWSCQCPASWLACLDVARGPGRPGLLRCRQCGLAYTAGDRFSGAGGRAGLDALKCWHSAAGISGAQQVPRPGRRPAPAVRQARARLSASQSPAGPLQPAYRWACGEVPRAGRLTCRAIVDGAWRGLVGSVYKAAHVCAPGSFPRAG
jgi:hypothetical protein